MSVFYLFKFFYFDYMLLSTTPLINIRFSSLNYKARRRYKPLRVYMYTTYKSVIKTLIVLQVILRRIPGRGSAMAINSDEDERSLLWS